LSAQYIQSGRQKISRALLGGQIQEREMKLGASPYHLPFCIALRGDSHGRFAGLFGDFSTKKCGTQSVSGDAPKFGSENV
jgi:hypothetical protein